MNLLEIVDAALRSVESESRFEPSWGDETYSAVASELRALKEKLAAELEDSLVVYGRTAMNGKDWVYATRPFENGGEATHRARLVNIEPLQTPDRKG